MTEALLAVAMSLAGLGTVLPWRWRLPDTAIGLMAFPMGAVAYLISGVTMLAVFGQVDPDAAMWVMAAPGAIGAAIAARRGLLDGRAVVVAGMVAAITALFAILAWLLPLARLTPDSGVYLLGAHQVQLPDAPAAIGFHLVPRQVGVQLLHALSLSELRDHVAFVGPLFGLSGIGLFGWFAWTRVAGDGRRRMLVVGGALVFLVSSNRLLYDFFYINAHIEMATLLLVAVLGVWLVLREGTVAWALPAGWCLAATLLFRPESPLMVALVLVPLAATSADHAVRRLIAIPVLTVLVIWYGGVLWRFAPGGGEIGITEPVFGGIVAVAGSAAVLLTLGAPRLARFRPIVGRLFVPALIVLLAVFVTTDPAMLWDSVWATAQNLQGNGWWLTTWAVMVPLLAIALVVHRVPEGAIWTRFLLGFAVLFWILPYVRGAPWRVATGDSGNRILAHVLMIALAFVLMAFAGTEDDRREVAAPKPT